MVRPPAILA